MKFITKDQLELANGGYLVEKGTTSALNHIGFVEAQNKAHYYVALSQKVSKSDFKGAIPASFSKLAQEVASEISADKAAVYVNKPDAPKLNMTDSLAAESLAWLDFEKSKVTTDKVNSIMQDFNVMAEFEQFGLYFSEDSLVKLNKIYTTEEVVEAVKILEPHLSV